ncbi:alpha/beta fold hydrolase [Calothrix membranacea FACHB-236]|nr:alpha/beta fold hydrolase [Calothrix membranacea FACHB-236]
MTNTYVLVHGAWLGKFCWDDLVSKLEAAGHTAVTLDLPGHGDDTTPANAITLESYRDAIIQTIGDRTNVILVGHSMAGLPISLVAEAIPQQLKALVFVCAYLPRNGESLLQLSQEDKDSHVGSYWRQDNPEQYSPPWIAAEGIVDVFCADCSPEVQEIVKSRHRPEPLAPFVTPVELTEANYGSVPRYYIETLNDHAVSHQLQTLMLSRVNVNKSFQLSASHSPFLSMPDRLATCLTEIG